MDVPPAKLVGALHDMTAGTREGDIEASHILLPMSSMQSLRLRRGLLHNAYNQRSLAASQQLHHNTFIT